MATVIAIILNHHHVETLDSSVHVEAQKSLPESIQPAPTMITETHQTAIDSIISFAEKDENEQAAIIKLFLAKSLKTMLKYHVH